MSFAVQTPAWLMALVLALLPLFSHGMRSQPCAYLAIWPEDHLSAWISGLLRLIAILAIAGLVLGMAGLYRTGHVKERIGHGAHVVLLLDRSNSMDNNFAGRAPSGNEESKSAAARRLLAEFVERRESGMMGVVEFTTGPLYVMPLTENKPAIQAAIAATATPALAYTHVSKGLAMALSYFQQQNQVSGSRVVLLVSDGAAAIDHDSEQLLREAFKQHQVRLYWIFLRTVNSPGIFEQPADSRDDNAQAMPELYLHRFFQTLAVPYQAYEAESPDALAKAIADINRLENLPMQYLEQIPRQDLSALCYGFAGFMVLILLAAKFAEVDGDVV